MRNLILTFAIILPFFKYQKQENDQWFYSIKGKQSAINAVVFSSLISIIYVVMDEYVLKSIVILNIIPDVISNGYIPFLILILGLSVYYKYLLKRGMDKNEIVQTIFIFIVSSFLIFTLIGIFFRGKGMALTI